MQTMQNWLFTDFICSRCLSLLGLESYPGYRLVSGSGIWLRRVFFDEDFSSPALVDGGTMSDLFALAVTKPVSGELAFTLKGDGGDLGAICQYTGKIFFILINVYNTGLPKFYF